MIKSLGTTATVAANEMITEAGRSAAEPHTSAVTVQPYASCPRRERTFLPQDLAMAERRLSEAVVIYFWGRPRTLPYPSEHPDDVVAVLGDDGLDLLPRIYAITAVVDSISDAEWPTFPGSLNEMAGRITAEVRKINPELDDEALNAIGNWWAFNNK